MRVEPTCAASRRRRGGEGPNSRPQGTGCSTNMNVIRLGRERKDTRVDFTGQGWEWGHGRFSLHAGPGVVDKNSF